MQRSDLIILAARPSMGKTSLATNIAFNTGRAYLNSGGKEGAVVGFFSLEMSSEQLATRILSEESEVPSERIRKGDFPKKDFVCLVEASNLIHKVPMFIDDTAGLTVSALRTRAMALKRQHQLGLIVVDYLQLMRTGGNSRQENRVQEISEITRGLKMIAKDLDMPVLALSQLSRQVEQREDKRPQLSDLRNPVRSSRTPTWSCSCIATSLLSRQAACRARCRHRRSIWNGKPRWPSRPQSRRGHRRQAASRPGRDGQAVLPIRS